VAELERAKGLKTEKPARAIWASLEDLELLAAKTDQEIVSLAAEQKLLSEIQSFTKSFGIQATQKSWDKGLSALARKFKKGKSGFDMAACVASLTEDLGAEAATKFGEFLKSKFVTKAEEVVEAEPEVKVEETKIEEVAEEPKI